MRLPSLSPGPFRLHYTPAEAGSELTVLSVAKGRPSHVEGRLEMCVCNPIISIGRHKKHTLEYWTPERAVSEGAFSRVRRTSLWITGYMSASTGSASSVHL